MPVGTNVSDMSANGKHRPEHHKKGVSNQRVSPSWRCVPPAVKAAHPRKSKPNERVDVRTGRKLLVSHWCQRPQVPSKGRIFLSAQGLVNVGLDRKTAEMTRIRSRTGAHRRPGVVWLMVLVEDAQAGVAVSRGHDARMRTATRKVQQGS